MDILSIMAGAQVDTTLQNDLMTLLQTAYPDMTVEVGESKRWKRPCATFRWSGFKGLLPEERFQRLAAALPEDVREKRMKGFVWVELCPGETIDEFLELPRSEDIAAREAEIYRSLVRASFFEKLQKAIGPSPDKRCRRDFSDTMDVLASVHPPGTSADDVKMLSIRHGAFCDCQLLLVVLPILSKLYADAA